MFLKCFCIPLLCAVYRVGAMGEGEGKGLLTPVLGRFFPGSGFLADPDQDKKRLIRIREKKPGFETLILRGDCFVYFAKALQLKCAKFSVCDSRVFRVPVFSSKVDSLPIASPKCLRVGCAKTFVSAQL